jgi:hypothetical protein
MRRHGTLSTAARIALFTSLVALIAFPAAGAPKGRKLSSAFGAHVSQSAAIRYWLAHPERAPEGLRGRFDAAQGIVQRASRAAQASVSQRDDDDDDGSPVNHVFNNDVVGLPQNEESVQACRTDTNLVISGTNDYRGLLDTEGNFTGWYLSTDGGASLAKEGLLPPVSEGGTDTRPSGGDPVFAFDRDGDCNIYATSINYDPVDPFANTNGVGLYKTDVDTLLSAACNPTPADLSVEDCWPTRRFAAFSSDATHFFDKEWFDVGDTGDGEHVWVTWSDFDSTPEPPNPAGFTAEIFAVRCDADLASCTDPIPISEDDVDVQFSDVTIGPDGRTYITWSQIFGELEGTAQTFVHKLRIAEAGSTEFGPEITIFSEANAIPFGGFMHSNDWRVATYPKNEVMDLGGDTPRIFLVWDACAFRLLDFSCEEAEIKLVYSDDDGASWSDVAILSAGGDNYFPAISAGSDRLAVAWFTNRRDTVFHNRQDVELASVKTDGSVTRRQRLTRPSNESEADPLLGGFFIGDYIEVFAHERQAWVGYNANYRQIQVLGVGFPITQQDNYLVRARI